MSRNCYWLKNFLGASLLLSVILNLELRFHEKNEDRRVLVTNASNTVLEKVLQETGVTLPVKPKDNARSLQEARREYKRRKQEENLRQFELPPTDFGAPYDANQTIIYQGGSKFIKLQYCDCFREVKNAKSTENVTVFNSSCSKDAYERGSGQKVISFFFYPPRSTKSMFKGRNYFTGIQDNLDLMARYYPGYVMRLYTDLTPEDKQMRRLCELSCTRETLDLCLVGNLPGSPKKDITSVLPSLWRILPMIDPQVDVFLSRDLDSRFTDREVAAVTEWQHYGKPFHVMRDHPVQGHPIMGASWGANLTHPKTRSKLNSIWKTILADKRSRTMRQMGYGIDHKLFQDYLWPFAKDLIVQHDSYHCYDFPGAIGFPTRREKKTNNFVGVAESSEATLTRECPEECRRKPKWIYC